MSLESQSQELKVITGYIAESQANLGPVSTKQQMKLKKLKYETFILAT